MRAVRGRSRTGFVRFLDHLLRRSCGHARLMRAADEAEEEGSAECVAALFDDVAASSCAAQAALARVPRRKASYADAAYWRGRYAAELAAAAAAAGAADAPPQPYEWHVALPLLPRAALHVLTCVAQV